MPRIVKGRRAALVIDTVVAVVMVAGAIAVGAMLALHVADWRAA